MVQARKRADKHGRVAEPNSHQDYRWTVRCAADSCTYSKAIPR